MSAHELERTITTLMKSAGMPGPRRITPLPGGANNRVFRVEAGASRVLVKAYFQHPDDPRDRLGTEFAFAQFAWSHGLRALPQPLVCDRQMGLGVYEFLDGRRLEPSEITAPRVAEAMAFFAQLNRHRHAPDAQQLPVASEACFSLAEHLACVDRRIARLRRVVDESPAHAEAIAFIHGELSEVWEATRASVPLALDAPLALDDRRLSPSDFGFHNALMVADGRLRFFDLEYAGWDDPAKTVCDFFCQPAVPVPLEHLDAVIDAVTQGLPDPTRQRQRILALWPVYRVKWCCILLNEFLPIDGRRRRFARSCEGQDADRRAQVGKARRALGGLSRSASQTAMVWS